ncbi:MAG: hypothetical protein ACRDHI_04290 [Actinomycetota bacterium]
MRDELMDRLGSSVDLTTMTIPGMGDESAVNESEADEMEEHLRGLGYFEWAGTATHARSTRMPMTSQSMLIGVRAIPNRS